MKHVKIWPTIIAYAEAIGGSVKTSSTNRRVLAKREHAVAAVDAALDAAFRGVNAAHEELAEKHRLLEADCRELATLRAADDPAPALPIPMLLTCPMPDCGKRHIDAGKWATRIHHTHSCQFCGHTWRPAVVPTIGVQFLPGFRD